MSCARCGRANRAGARFCGGCGTPLAPRCPACGNESELDAQFCDACGASLGARPAGVAGEAEARKVVTVVFADLIGSTSLHERLDAESARRLMDRYYWTLQSAVEVHGGTVAKLLGDGVLAAFGVPRVAEDDAIRAVRAAVAIVEKVSGLSSQVSAPDTEPLTPDTRLSVRVGVNTGEVVVSADNTDVVGDPVNVAARLQQEAHDSEVLIGESTRRLVSELVTLAPYGALTLKGRSETVAAYRVVSLERPAGAGATAFVGREGELRRIRAVYDAAGAAPAARLVVVLGSPGLGKSRLLDEFSRRLGDAATVLTTRCDPAGGATFAPMARAMRALLRLDDGVAGASLRAAIDAVVPGDDSERGRITHGIAGLLAGSPASPEETFFVVRRFLAALATTRPVLLAIDDLQWAEPLLLDLVEHLVEWGSGVRLVVLVAARPELRDVRSSLTAAGGVVAEVVTLAGLDAGAATRLAANVIGADALPAAVAGRVLAASEGNPLFVGELVRMLVNDGVLERAGDRWTTSVALADLEMPPTIHALLAARIERLQPEDRMVLERAAVVGRQFSRSAIAHLLPGGAPADLDARLDSLRRSELIESDAAWFVGEPALRFHHALIRDAAYRRLLKGTRAELHGRLADWIEARVGDAVEHDEMIGWHLEQAHQHLRELRPLDARGRSLGERAARYLAAAGRRALVRDDVSVAAGLLGRAIERLDREDPTRADLALDWCETLLAAGDVTQAKTAIDELGSLFGASAPSGSLPLPRADQEGSSQESSKPIPLNPPALQGEGRSRRGRLRAWHTCFTGQLAVLTDPQALRATIDAVAGAASELAAAGDASGEAQAHWVHALALVRLGQVGACEAALDRALAASRRAGDRRRANAVLAGAPLAALWGPSPVTRASGRCLDVVRVLRITQGAPAVEAVALRCQAVLEALRGRTDAARRMIASSRRMLEELGITQQLLEADVFAGLIELLEGDGAAAERYLRGAYDGLRNHGLGIDAARVAALLGRAALMQGRSAEAEALSHEGEALAGDDLKANIAWRGVRAEALARRGEHAAAVALARAAVDIAAATDALLDHADARLALAAALRAAGRNTEADAEEARAIELWEAKGAKLLAERVRPGAPSISSRIHDASSFGPSLSGGEEEERTAAWQLRRVRSNAATANVARLDAALARRDAGVLPSLFADDLNVVHHPTGATYDREGALFSLRSLLAASDLAYRHEPLATLGEALLLCRLSTSFSALPGVDFGPFGAVEKESFLLIEVDASGRQRWAEFFAADRLADAVARLHRRYAELLPEGPARTRAEATACSVAALLGPLDFDRYAAAIAPGVEFADYRRIGFPPARGAGELLRSLHTLVEAAEDRVTRVDDILALHPEAFLVRWTTSGTHPISHGPFEGQFLRLCIFGADGRLTHAEQFDVDASDQALARFDELASASTTKPMIENAATRTEQRARDAWVAQDWEGYAALFTPSYRSIDRRAMAQIEIGREQFLEVVRPFIVWTESQLENEILATRGDRLALLRIRFESAEGLVGPSHIEWLAVIEVDERGALVLSVGFNPDDLDGAYAELEDRYAAEAADSRRAALTRTFTQAFAARDWDTLATLLTPDLLVNDHRLLGWETLHGPAAYIQALKQLVELAPDVQLRLDHLTMSDPRFLYVTTWVGTREGGAFETPSAIVCELDAMGRICRFDQYDLDQIEEARARLETKGAPTNGGAPPDLVGVEPGEVDDLENVKAGFAEHHRSGADEPLPDAPRALPNAAARLRDRINDAVLAGDWPTLRALASDDLVFEDQRKFAVVSGGVEIWIKSQEALRTATEVRFMDDLIGTLGDRIALHHRIVAGSGPDGGVFDAEIILLTEIDADGRLAASINFDVEARSEAFAKAHDRFAAGEAATPARRAPVVVKPL